MAGDVDGVVSGAGDDRLAGVAELGRALADQVDAAGVERLGRDAEQRGELQPDPAGVGDGARGGGEFVV